MKIFLLVLHPAFSWLILFAYGLEAIHRGLPSSTIVALGLAGLSQSYWKFSLGEHKPYQRSDVAAFICGLLAALAYVLLIICDLLGGSVPTL